MRSEEKGGRSARKRRTKENRQKREGGREQRINRKRGLKGRTKE